MSNKEQKEQIVSERLREVWQWKEAIYREVANLPTDQALREILRKACSSAQEVDLPRHSPSRALSTPKQCRTTMTALKPPTA